MTTQQISIALAGIFAVAIGAQWFAWRLHVPAIIPLLLAGIVVGPVTNLVQPEELLGDLLFPVVSLSVGVVLFEGSSRLRFRQLREIGAPLIYLLSVGVLITWALAAWASYAILQMPGTTAILLGALLTVTGPTVIGPMLQHIRPSGRVGRIAQWEGIVVDPIGAVLAVLTFEVGTALAAADYEHATSQAALGLARTVAVGAGIGLTAAVLLIVLLWRRWVPDRLHSAITLAAVFGALVAANLLQHESGLLAVTAMGIALANQRWADIRHVVEFKETLSVLLVSCLFVVLAARVPLDAFTAFGWRGPAFVAALILIVRPAAVFVSTWPTSLTIRERAFLAWLAPRGIVAAAVASVFGIQLAEAGQGLVPATFMVIAGTVVVYGVTAPFVARKLGVATPNPQGVLILGASPMARAIAKALKEAGFRVLLVDNDSVKARAARMEGFETEYADVLSVHAAEELDLGGLGRLLALLPNDELNSLAAVHFAEFFGRDEVYQLVPRDSGSGERRQLAEQHFRGHFLFSPQATYQYLEDRMEKGAIVKTTRITQEFTAQHFHTQYQRSAVPLFLVSETGRLRVCTAKRSLEPSAGQTIIALVDPPEREGDS